MTANDVTRPQVAGSDPEVMSFDRKSPGSGCRRPKTCVYCAFTSYKTSSQEEAVISQDDVTWPQVTGSDSEVTSFERKSPGSGRRRTKTGVYCVFAFREGSSSQDESVTWQEMTSRDLRWPEVTRKWRHLTGSHLEVAVENRKLAYTVFDFLQGYSSQQEAVTWRKLTSRDLRWPEVALKWRHLTGNHLEVAVEGGKLAYTVCLTYYKAVARRRRQSRDRIWRHVTSGDRKWFGSDVIWPEVTWKWL